MKKETIEVTVFEPGDVMDIHDLLKVNGETAVVVRCQCLPSGKRAMEMVTDQGKEAVIWENDIACCKYIDHSSEMEKFFQKWATTQNGESI